MILLHLKTQASSVRSSASASTQGCVFCIYVLMYLRFDLYKIAHPCVEADAKEHALLVLSNIQNGAMVTRRDELLKKSNYYYFSLRTKRILVTS